MTSNPKPIQGICPDMCPLKERQMREREGLLHKLERVDNDLIRGESIGNGSARIRRPNKVNPPQSRIRKFNRQGDINRVIKSFSRSAAGMDKTSPDDLRPAPVLEKTADYLFTQILPRTDYPFTTIYDFIFDRLRSIAQDLTIQRICNLSAIRIIESIIRFHIYAGYRHERPATFERHINRKHLHDNLKRLLSLYESNSYWQRSRMEFEILYILINPDSATVLNRALNCRKLDFFNTHKSHRRAIDMAFAFQSHNYVLYFKLFNSLQPLLAASVYEYCIVLRGKAFQRLSITFGASTCKFPLGVLQSLLEYPTSSSLEKDLLGLCITVTSNPTKLEEKVVVFSKAAQFSNSQMENISQDFESLVRPDNIMNSSHVDKVVRFIWPPIDDNPT